MRRARAALTGLALAGCVPVALPPIPLPRPSPVRADGANELRPIERLGRFDGERFVAVTPRSVPPSHVYVLVHGWAPGWGDEIVEEPRLRSWEARTRRGQPFERWVTRLARAIHDADPHAVVLAYSWLDDAATGRFLLAQRRAFAHTDLHGHLLAEALDESIAEGFVHQAGRMHLIGHSYGARVVTLAAIHLPKKPQHVTLFDSPDAPLTYVTGTQAMLASLLRKLPIGSAQGRVFVDNYVSMVGAAYHESPGLAQVVDVSLTPPYGTLDYRGRHLYPMEFYARTVGRSFGFGWSPLIARSRRPPPGCYQQPYGRMRLERGCVPASLAP